MAKASSQDLKNLSPFAGGKKKEKSGLGFMLIGALGILAAVALILRALVLKA